jgi:hypothetical protein
LRGNWREKEKKRECGEEKERDGERVGDEEGVNE